jgi:hypothetical protein
MEIPERHLNLIDGKHRKLSFSKYNYTAFCAATRSFIDEYCKNQQK